MGGVVERSVSCGEILEVTMMFTHEEAPISRHALISRFARARVFNRKNPRKQFTDKGFDRGG